MGSEWRQSTWGDEISLEYGKRIRGYKDAKGPYRVFGSNGPVGWTTKPLTEGPGVILGRKGAYRGVEYSKEPFFVIDTAYYVKPKSNLDMRWLYYAIKHYNLGEINDGSPIPSTTRAAVYVRELSIPPLPEQRAIAHILGSLDDKIELNRRMNETLEAMAQALFKSWFVDFDPVIDNALAAGNPIPEELQARAALRESLGDGRKPLPDNLRDLFPSEFALTEEMGWIPKGWVVGTLGDISEILNGFAFKSKDYTPRGVFVLRTKNFSNSGHVEQLSDDVYLPECFLLSHKNYICEEFDFFLVMVGASVGKVSMLFSNCLPALRNQNMWCFRPKNGFGSRFYINNSVTMIVKLHSQIASGSARDFFRKEDFKRLNVIIPDSRILQFFEDRVGILYQRISLNHEKNDSLTQSRDTLLPKLLSGEIRIPEAEKLMEAAG